MTLKTIVKNKLIWIIVFSVIGLGLSYNLYHYTKLKQNAGYTIGKVTESRMSGKGGRSWKTVYTYQVKEKNYTGKQSKESLKVNDLCVVVYNKKSPEISIIVDYYLDLNDSLGEGIKIDTNYVDYSVWDFKPGWGF